MVFNKHIAICEDYKPYLLALVNDTLKYTSYVRMSVYKKAYAESSWCKEKTHHIDNKCRSVLNRFCDYCLVNGQLSLEKFALDNEFKSIMNSMHSAWSELNDFVIDINHKNNTDIMDYNTFTTDAKRKEGLNKLL